MATRSLILLALAGLGLAVPALAGPAPAALYGKTVVLAWTEHRSQRTDAGQVSNSTTRSSFLVYVSSAGRLFSRFVRADARSGRSNSSLLGPGGDTTMAGQGASHQTTHFEGNRLISDNAMRSGARRILAEFAAGFRTCSLRVIYGKENGALQYHRAMNGKMYYILSTEVISPTCAVREGNVFAAE